MAESLIPMEAGRPIMWQKAGLIEFVHRPLGDQPYGTDADLSAWRLPLMPLPWNHHRVSHER